MNLVDLQLPQISKSALQALKPSCLRSLKLSHLNYSIGY
jgi:hypothetical protein